MLLATPLILAFIAAVNSKAITWTQPLPTGYTLINKDELSLPIDEYVSLSSAIFTTTDPTKNVIVPKVQVLKQATSSQGNNMQSCSLADNSRDSFAIFVCSKNLIRIEKNDNFMLDGKDQATSVNLVTPGSASPALKDTSTLCTDMFNSNGKYYINCYDTSATSNPNYIFSVTESLNITSTPMTIGTCDSGDLKGDSKFVKLSTNTANKIPLLFYDVSRTSNPTPGTINVPYCNLDATSAFVKSTGQINNLYTIMNEQTYSKGVLKFIASWSATELIAFIAVDDSSTSTKAIFFVPFTIDDNGAITKHATFKAVNWTGVGVDGFNPNYMTFAKTTGTNMFIASDKANLYSFNFNTDFTLKTPVWNVVLDCGLATNTAVYISRLEVGGGNGDITNPASRTLIVYNTGDSKKVREFAVHINNTKYGCSRATTAADSSKLDVVNTVSFTSDTYLITTADNKLSKSKINYNTMLSISVTEETADKSCDISVKMDGWDSPSAQKFTYKSIKNAQDFNSITISSKSYKTYGSSFSYLGIPQFSFQGNNPTISSTNTNVKLRYSSAPSVSLTGLAIADYDIHRIFAVDEDTFVAVLRKAGSPEAFIRFWNKWDGATNNVTVQGSTVKALAANQILFKMFKVGPSIFCAVYKSNGSAAKKLTMSCFKDSMEAPELAEANNVVITDTFEISDIQVLESDSRVDLYMIGTATTIQENAVIHYYITLGSDGKVVLPDASYVSKIDITSKELLNYYPTDIMYDVWGDDEGTNYITIKQVSKFNLGPVVSKYNVSVGTSATSPPKFTYIYHMYIPSQNTAFCAIKNEIIFFTPKTRSILVNKMIRVPTGVTLPQNKLYLPVAEYGISYLQQFNCIPEKGIFQVLGVDSAKNKYLINFRGGDSTNGARRVHSVVKLASTASFLETAFNGEYIVSVVNSPGKIDVVRNFVYTYPEGPKFIVDNTNMKDSYDVSISSSSQSSATSSAVVKVEIVNPTYKAEVKPRETFQISEGKTIYLDQVSNIVGPVMDIKIEGTDASKVKLVKRNNKYKGYTGGETTTADRVFAEQDFMVLMWSGSKYKIMGDPAMTKTTGDNPSAITTVSSVNIKEATLIRYGNLDQQAILVTRIYSGTTYKYSVTHLSRTTNNVTPVTYTYNFVQSDNLYETTTDYDSLQAVTINDQDVIVALKMKKAFNSNYIRLLSFKKDTGNKFLFRGTTILTVDSTKEIGGHTLVWNGKDKASVVAFYKDYDYLIYGEWDGVATTTKFRPSMTKIKLSDTESITFFTNGLRCWTGATAGTLECYVDAAGVGDYLVTMTLDASGKLEVDPITSIVKTGDFEMPPLFEVKRVDRGKEHYGFLMTKSAINSATSPSTRRLLQSMALDKFSDCTNIIVFFKPTVGRFIYTGITCSEWGNNTNIDFAMEYDTNEYVYITKWPASNPAVRRVLQTSTNDRVGANYLAPIQVTVNQAIDPNQVKLTFLGLNGPNDPATSNAVTLNDFKQGAPPSNNTASSGSSFWTWFIIILVVLLIIGGGVYGYMWYQNNQANSSSSTYTKQVDRNSSKSDLEDTRL